VHLATGQIAGFEALLRWQHQSGLRSPQTFIGVAERTGLVVPLGKWALREACRQAQSWRSRQPWEPLPSASVNVSPKQFAHPNLVRDVASVLEETGIAPERLHLEITEGLAMADPEKTEHVMRELKNLGVLISIDDFGTGHSSLARLRRFPADVLKIDRSFVSQVDTDKETREIVRLIVEFAHAVNLKVIAEGVETAAQAAQLKALGCEFVQGHFFSKPVDEGKVKDLLATRLPLRENYAQPEPNLQASAAKAR
jgi:EAL domain-containing protein (putative c-di-GMP-specific phosphodiesterase class I)